MQLQSRIVWSLLLLIVGICHAHPTNGFDDVHDDNEQDAWKAGVFTPQPLKPPSWLVTTTTPRPPPSDGLQIPGVGILHGLLGYKEIRNRPIDAYLGVRYAQVGGGLERFQPATPVPYQAHINATRSTSNCAQFPELQRLQAAEARGENVDDCLTLNIYAPAGATQLPVLVFVHGEMLFDGGAEEAQPDYVLEHDVVLVSINYRLAPFGFLSALSSELPGNVALSDLQLALEWVQRNVRYFGGASDRVTLIGQAGGATLAHALSLSPRTQHLFQQLILQSGTALNPYLIDETPLNTLATFAQLARCPPPGRSLSSLYECLRRMRTSQLVSVFEQLHQQNEPRGLTALGGFKLVVGDPLGFLPAHPAALVADNSKNNRTKPMILGAAKDASAFIVSRFYDQIRNLRTQNISDYINVVLRHTAPPQHHKIWHDLALREIFSSQHVHNPNAPKVTQGLLELSNLILYRAPVIDSIRLSYKKSPTYEYIFDYRGEHHRFGHLDSPLPFGVDASLSDDSVYLFPYPEEASNLNPEDKSLARALVTMWVNFAQNGIPNPNTNVWPKVSSEYGPFLRFTNSPQSILELDQHFGEGINVPSLYPQYLSTANTTATTSTTTTTTTTTTRRPYFNYRAPQQPDYRRPVASPNPYARAQEERRQQLLRQQQQELELKQREQQEREQQQREELLRQEEDRRREQRQRDEQLQREQMQREQFEREQRQRDQQEREQSARRQQEDREQQEREQEQREIEMRQQQEREQRQKQQQEREQQERSQWQEGVPSETEQEQEQRQREQQEREQQERSQEERDQEAREQHEREQQQREQQEREQQERSQWQEGVPNETEQEQEQRQREQQEREQQERSQEERDQEAREQHEREQQQREQIEREQQERDQEPQQGPNPDSYATYEDYVKAYQDWIQEQEKLYDPQANASSEQDPAEAEASMNNAHEQPNHNSYQQYGEAQNNPRRLKLMSRQQRRRF